MRRVGRAFMPARTTGSARVALRRTPKQVGPLDFLVAAAANTRSVLARLAGLEPATLGLEGTTSVISRRLYLGVIALPCKGVSGHIPGTFAMRGA